ncbi:MAG: tRNA preQ1(34) S-adenosylmethionine ribosyltransferase-isomerase QueA [Vampirovibrio sp.]|nr:tRNA preQ1(34) S-adenosylmethionine ribosyltransferase-isomerase QueA [Vampirovibrio sp.]
MQPTDTTNASLSLDAYDYQLPEALVAQYPLSQRHESRMMVLNRKTGEISHHRFYDLPQFLDPGDLVVLNNTKVLPSRFLGNRVGFTGRIEVLLLYPNAEATQETSSPVWHALLRPARKLKEGTVIEFLQISAGISATMTVYKLEEGGRGQVAIDLPKGESVETLMDTLGQMPIPPYLNRPVEPSDKETYQTVFASVPGAQAAPTAGLHFTPEVLQQLKDKDIGVTEVTLSVSSGTFRSVDESDITRHVMDPEYYTVPEAAARQIHQTRQNGGRIIAIGTTVTKTLETVAAKHQGKITPGSDWSRLFIYPGFQFQAVDMLLTNFHLPKTTLLMLVSAFANRESILKAYHQAVANEYRFFSYGDCMLIL